MQSLGSSRVIFDKWPAAGPSLSSTAALPVACRQGAIPCSAAPQEGSWWQAGAGGVLLCATTFSPSFVPKSFSHPSVPDDLLHLVSPVLSCLELTVKFGGCPGQAGGVETGL